MATLANMAYQDSPKVYTLLEPSRVTRFFSRFPVGINLRAVDVENALKTIDIQASAPDTRERRRALIRHSNPYGDPFALCHCSADPERLVLLASIVEVMWIHDDVTEELDHHRACKAHTELSEVLRIDIDPSSIYSNNVRQGPLAAMLRKAIDIDPAQGVQLVHTLRNYLMTFDIRDDDFDRMDDYMPYRIANCGYWISSYFIRWGMGLTMSDEEYESIQSFDIAMGNILGLTNDYFSWEVEKDQPTDRIRNAVRVLTKEHQIPSDAAQSMLLGIIVQEEARAAKLKQQRLQSPVSQSLSRYFEAIELYVGGSCYWHATAPRYQKFE